MKHARDAPGIGGLEPLDLPVAAGEQQDCWTLCRNRILCGTSRAASLAGRSGGRVLVRLAHKKLVRYFVHECLLRAVIRERNRTASALQKTKYLPVPTPVAFQKSGEALRWTICQHSTFPLISIRPPPVRWSRMNRTLIIGATSTVGRQVLSQLAATGAQVRALTRNPDAARLPPQVEVVRGDLTLPGRQVPTMVFRGLLADNVARLPQNVSYYPSRLSLRRCARNCGQPAYGSRSF
jgi:NAD(P)H-binding